MKRGDRVEIRRGVWKGHEALVTEVTSSGQRVGVRPLAATQPHSLAATSVRKLADK